MQRHLSADAPARRGARRLGGDFRYFGFRVGSMVFQRWPAADAPKPEQVFLPTVDLRFARRDGLVGLAGFGAYDTRTLFRPGLWGGVGYLEPRGFGVEMRVGGHLVFDDQTGLRGDVRVRYAFDDVFALGLGGAAQITQQLTPEGSLFFVVTP